jgi:itaconyl-CoA hydratase
MSDFTAYVPTGENRYRERFGLDFEQFAVGQKFQHRPGLTLSQQDSRDECLDTLNQQMLHFDEQFATHTEWQKCLMDSTLTTKVVLGMTWKTFAKRTRLLGFDEITLTKPLFGGDTLYAESEIVEKADWVGAVALNGPEALEGKRPYLADINVGRLRVVTQGINQRGEAVAKLVYELLMARAGHDHFTRINY